MDYVVFDLEFNQAFDFKKGKAAPSNPGCPFEILQIGAIKLDEALTVTDTFNALVKPQIYHRIHPYVAGITGIAKKHLQEAKPFPEVFADFIQFLVGHQIILCVWGTADLKELFRNVTFYNLDFGLVPKEYINVQAHASQFLHTPGGSSIGLRNAVELLKIPMEGDFHDAYHDALYTAEVLKKIYIASLQPEKYTPITLTPRLRDSQEKTRLDTKKLFAQFEKMYKRKLTHREKNMIELSYKMGNTNQFQVRVSSDTPPNEPQKKDE